MTLTCLKIEVQRLVSCIEFTGEFYLLKVRPSTSIQMSVYLMILGSIVAASNDLAFNLRG